jgi:mRNA-degrading endonuclease RelE of RelBE toxin-antitoxin system
MKTKVRVTKNFKKQAKKLLKKYASLRNELMELESILLNNPYHGTKLNENLYKIRVAVKSKGKGKSGGLRAITYLETEVVILTESMSNFEITVNLIAIYDKSETENITSKEITELIKNIDYSNNDND